jgi:hypothetical protein
MFALRFVSELEATKLEARVTNAPQIRRKNEGHQSFDIPSSKEGRKLSNPSINSFGPTEHPTRVCYTIGGGLR